MVKHVKNKNWTCRTMITLGQTDYLVENKNRTAIITCQTATMANRIRTLLNKDESGKIKRLQKELKEQKELAKYYHKKYGEACEAIYKSSGWQKKQKEITECKK